MAGASGGGAGASAPVDVAKGGGPMDMSSLVGSLSSVIDALRALITKVGGGVADAVAGASGAAEGGGAADAKAAVTQSPVQKGAEPTQVAGDKGHAGCDMPGGKVGGESGGGVEQKPEQRPEQRPEQKDSKVGGEKGKGEQKPEQKPEQKGGGKVGGESGKVEQKPEQRPEQKGDDDKGGKVGGKRGRGRGRGRGHDFMRGQGHLKFMREMLEKGSTPSTKPASQVDAATGSGVVQQSDVKGTNGGGVVQQSDTEVKGDSGVVQQSGGDVKGDSGVVQQSEVKGDSGTVEQSGGEVKGDSGVVQQSEVKGDSGVVQQSEPAKTEEPTQVAGETGSDPSKGDEVKGDSGVVQQSGGEVKGDSGTVEQSGPVQQTPAKEPVNLMGDEVIIDEHKGSNEFHLIAKNGSALYFRGTEATYQSVENHRYTVQVPTDGFRLTMSDGTKIAMGIGDTDMWGEIAGTPRDLEIIGPNDEFAASRLDGGGADEELETPLTEYHLIELFTALMDKAYGSFSPSKEASKESGSVEQSGVVQQS